MWNKWYQMLQSCSTAMVGDMPFIEFTYDGTWFEIEEGTPREMDPPDLIAPWLLTPGLFDLQSYDQQQRNKYRSAWKVIYTPGLIERMRPIND